MTETHKWKTSSNDQYKNFHIIKSSLVTDVGVGNCFLAFDSAYSMEQKTDASNDITCS